MNLRLPFFTLRLSLMNLRLRICDFASGILWICALEFMHLRQLLWICAIKFASLRLQLMNLRLQFMTVRLWVMNLRLQICWIQLPITYEAFKACSPRIFWNIVNFCFFCYLELCHKQCQFTSKDSVSPIGLGKLSPVIQTLKKTEYLSETKSNNSIMGIYFLGSASHWKRLCTTKQWLCPSKLVNLRHIICDSAPTKLVNLRIIVVTLRHKIMTLRLKISESAPHYLWLCAKKISESAPQT